jgi:hypothetical protein
MRPCLLHVCLIAVSPSIVVSAADAAPPDPPQAFDTADMHVEKNATDDDTEIVIEAVGGDDGLCQFGIQAPAGRPILHFNSVDRSTGGQREFLIESPEPSGDAILANYPEGLYRFRGRSCEGERFASTASLSHDLPAATVITSPAADSEVDVSNGLVIEWSAVPGIAEFILELENESADPEQSLSLNLPPDTTHFEVRQAGLRLAANTRWVWPPCRPTATWCLSKPSSPPPSDERAAPPSGRAVGLPSGHTEHPRVQAERCGIDRDCDQRADDTHLSQGGAELVATAGDGGERKVRRRERESLPMLTEGVAALAIDRRGAADGENEQ